MIITETQKSLKYLAEIPDRDLLYLIEDAEEELSIYSGMPHSILMTSGLTALQAALYASGVKEGDEVVCDAIFPFAIMAILGMGAKPIVAELDEETLTLSAISLRKVITPQTKAIIATAVFGIPPETTLLRNTLLECSKKFNIKDMPVLIEDHAQAFGTEINGSPSASNADMVCYSFHIDKPLSSGFGGAVVCKNKKHEIALRQFINLGWYPRMLEDGSTDWESSWRERESHCQSARIPPIAAGILLQRLNTFPATRQEHISVVKTIEKKLSKLKNIKLQKVPLGFSGQRWRIAIICTSSKEAEILVKKLTLTGSHAYQYVHPPASKWPNLKQEWFNELPITTKLMKQIVTFSVMNNTELSRELSALESIL